MSLVDAEQARLLHETHATVHELKGAMGALLPELRKDVDHAQDTADCAKRKAVVAAAGNRKVAALLGTATAAFISAAWEGIRRSFSG